jgi:hypothetical protein
VSDEKTEADSVDVAYSTDGGTNWIDIATVTDGNQSIDWTVPSTETSNALIRVTATDTVGNTARDRSNSSFSISVPPDESSRDRVAPRISQFDVEDTSNPAGNDSGGGPDNSGNDNGATKSNNGKNGRGSGQPGAFYQVDWTAEDADSGIATVRLSLIEASSGNTVDHMEWTYSGVASASQSDTLNKNGNGATDTEYRITLTVTDEAGNTKTVSWTDTADGAGSAQRDPGHAYEDLNRNGVFDQADQRIALGTLESEGITTSHTLIVPDSVGVVDIGDEARTYSGANVVFAARLNSRGKLTLKATSGTLDLRDTVLDNYRNANGKGPVVLSANEQLVARDLTVQSGGKLDVDAQSATLDGARVDNYQRTNGDGAIDISVSQVVSANRGSFNSGQAISISGGNTDLSGATFDNYQNTNGAGAISVSAGRSLTASGASFDSGSSVSLSGQDPDLSAVSINTYQNTNGEGSVTLTASSGSLDVSRGSLTSGSSLSLSAPDTVAIVGSTVSSAGSLTVTGERVSLGAAEIDTYLGGNGEGSVSVSATNGNSGTLSGVEASIQSAASVQLTGQTVTLDRASVNNYQNGNGEGSMTIQATAGNAGAVSLEGGTVAGAGSITVKGASVDVSASSIDNYQNNNGEDGITLSATSGNSGMLVATTVGIDTSGSVTLNAESITLDKATIDTYQNTNGDGAVSVKATSGTSGPISAEGVVIDGSRSISFTGESVTLDESTLDNYQNTNGDGSITISATAGNGGDVSLVGSIVDSGSSGTAKARSSGTVDVQGARFRHAATPFVVSQGDAINEAEIAEGDVDDGDEP